MSNTVKVISPQYKVGASVILQGRYKGTIAEVYPNSGAPMWYGTERLLHTHCYHLLMESGSSFWGAVDAELTTQENPGG